MLTILFETVTPDQILHTQGSKARCKRPVALQLRKALWRHPCLREEHHEIQRCYLYITLWEVERAIKEHISIQTSCDGGGKSWMGKQKIKEEYPRGGEG